MSETQGTQFGERCGEEKSNGILNEFGGNNDGDIIGDDKNSETMKETMHEASQLPQESHTTSRRLIKSPSTDDHPRQPGECRLLPVLVDLRSSLETTVPSSRSNQSTDLITAPKLDLNYFQDLCTSTDLKAALSRLEETLKRVDLNALSKYTSSLEPSDKYHLLQLITTLVTNLKRARLEESDEQNRLLQGLPATLAPRRPRRRGNRHTIGVSTEELASARRWLEQVGQSAITLTPRNPPKLEPSSTAPSNNPPSAPISNDNQKAPTNQRTSDCPWGTSNDLKTCDKHMKDAINQKQSLQHRIKDNETAIHHEEPLNDHGLLNHDDKPEKFNFNQHQITKSNKFTAKKTKLKRANTIDIPNYLKLQADKQKFNSNQFGLRKPIDISDKSVNQYCSAQLTNASPSIPEFRPKTENDRKFLALINKNNGSHVEPWKNPAVSASTSPFKSFNYRQTNSVADKNWKSRFSNIKTAFDQPPSASSSPASSIISTMSAGLRRQSTEFSDNFKVINDNSRSFMKNCERSVNPSQLTSIDSQTRHQIYQPVPAKSTKFTHAAGSPFKKVETPKIQDFRNPSLPIVSSLQLERAVPSSYLPACASGGLLAAKVRLFDSKSHPPPELPQRAPTYLTHQKPANRPLRTEEVRGHLQQLRPEEVKGHLQQFRTEDVKGHLQQSRTEEVPAEKFRLPKFQQYVNSVDDYHMPRNDPPKSSKIEKQIQVDADNIKIPDSSQNYQSVAVQTSARPSPRPPTPVEDLPPPIFRAPESAETFYAQEDNPIYVPPQLRQTLLPSVPVILDQHQVSLDALGPLHDANLIENQDITDDKVITRYTAAIGTLAPLEPSSLSSLAAVPNAGRPIVLHDEMIIGMKPPVLDDIQRHNLLQLSLIKRLNHDDQQNQIFDEPMIEANNTLDKINIFEEKAVPKINVTSPTKVNPSTIKVQPIDSSDEYLVSCSNRPNRSIVLSKSESWHQLAIGGRVQQHLQVPQQHPKPPKSQSSQRFAKNCDGNMKKMEEKVQRYFGNPGGVGEERGHKSERKEKRRSFSPRKMPNHLARSHTMPHVFDDTFDVDKAFDHVFEETTRDYRF